MNFAITLVCLPTVVYAASQSVSMLTLRGKHSNALVLSVKQVSSRLECTTYCLANTACEAANVIRHRRDDTVTCQMLRDAVDAEDDLEDNSDSEYLYRGERTSSHKNIFVANC